MRKLLAIIFAATLPTMALADAESDKKELTELGAKIVKAAESGKPDWSCVGKSGRDFCKTGADHYDLEKKEVKVSGKILAEYLESLKAMEAKENACLDPINKSGKFISNNWKEYDAAIKCLRAIDYSAIKQPDNIRYFYIQPGAIFSQNKVEEAVTIIQGKRDELNPSLKPKAESGMDLDGKKGAHSAKQKRDTKAYPHLLPASAFLTSNNNHKGKLFIAVIRGQGIVAIRPDRGTFEQTTLLASCQFNYLNTEEDIDGVGDGHYLFNADFYGCKIIEDMEGHPTNGETLLVRFEGTASMINKLGQKLLLPLFRVVAFDRDEWIDTRGGPFNPKDQIK